MFSIPHYAKNYASIVDTGLKTHNFGNFAESVTRSQKKENTYVLFVLY